MKYVFLLSSIVLVFIFSGCSGSRQVFEPEHIDSEWKHYKDSDVEVCDVTSDVAILDNYKVLTKDGVLNVEVKPPYRVLSKSDGWILSSTVEGKLKLQSVLDSDIQDLDLKKTIATASVSGDTLAVLFADNEMAIYSLADKKLLFKEMGGSAYANDTHIVKPFFMRGLAIFSTLDGKIVIVDLKKNKRLRSAIVSSKSYFNNIIYFNLVDNKIISATGSKIYSLSKTQEREKYEARYVTSKGNNIYLATKQGEIVWLNPSLVENKKVKFPFAHFLGLIVNDENVYALEKEGYLIVLNRDLSSYKIYEVDLDDGHTFIGNDKFYTADKIIYVK